MTQQLEPERYVSKPEYIQVVRLTEENLQDVGDWIGADSIEVTMSKGKQTKVRFHHDQQGLVHTEVQSFVVCLGDGLFYGMTQEQLSERYEKVQKPFEEGEGVFE